MEQKILDEVREIKKSLRLAMNGIVSTLQRRQGLDYKINFGVEVPRLKGIAEAHEKSSGLATTLWQDNIRECKMLAIFLMPEEAYCTVADKWVEDVRFTEIADQLAMHLLCKLPDAWDKALQWTGKQEGLYGYCGFLTVSHLVRRDTRPSAEQEQAFFNSIIAIDRQERQDITALCALNALTNYLDRFQDAAARFKKTMDDNDYHSTGLTSLTESFDI